MYIIKNAFRSLGRSKGRNILIGIIATVIAISSCIGLSIRQAAESARKSALSSMSVTATISYDRAGQMGQMGQGGGNFSGERGGMQNFDRSDFADIMGKSSSLSLEEYQKYAQAESVSDFYYTVTLYVNGNDDFLPISDGEEDSEGDENTSGSDSSFSDIGGGNFPGGMGDFSKMFSSTQSGDFTIVGYSSDSAMTDFISGNSQIKEGGAIFEEGTSDYVCVISEELALYNNLSVGDTVVITNPSLESESYTLSISGIYTSTTSNDFSLSAFGASQDPANRIFMSAAAVQSIAEESKSVSVTLTDEDTGRESESNLSTNLSATYSFATAEDYYSFEEQARELGLGDEYAVSSQDISNYENSLTPLTTLSTMAKWFLVVILIIGGIILVVINIFNVRERKYEVGVLTAMGMKKRKVAAQFMCEILAITMIAVIIGAAVGAVGSVPITNALLESQIESRNSQKMQVDSNFGRQGNFPGGMGTDFPSVDLPDDIDISNNPFEKLIGGASNYISEVDSAMNLTVVIQMIGVGLFLTLVASAASVLFIMRYDPLKILANRD